MKQTAFLVSLCIATCLLGSPSTDAQTSTPIVRRFVADNPFMQTSGLGHMHKDGAQSDATPLPGPIDDDVGQNRVGLTSACPTFVQRSDGLIFALCVGWLAKSVDNRIFLRLMDNVTGQELDTVRLPGNANSLSGVYGYLDHQDRFVAVDTDGYLRFYSAVYDQRTGWFIAEPTKVDLSSHLASGDRLVAPMPDPIINAIWWVSKNGVVGIYHQGTGAIESIALRSHADADPNEEVHNSFALVSHPTGGARASIVTTHGLYELGRRQNLVPQWSPTVTWRRSYDRGPGRKEGQLSHGSGTTPTFFGPTSGTEYVVIGDNAVPRMNLRVFESVTGTEVCTVTTFPERTVSGSEDSPMALGRSIIIQNTYGYPYPSAKSGSPWPDDPRSGFRGGLERYDVETAANGTRTCKRIWVTDIRSSAVPTLSYPSGGTPIIHTMIRDKNRLIVRYRYTQINALTGVAAINSGSSSTALADTLQMSGLVTAENEYWQPCLSGFIRVFSGNQ